MINFAGLYILSREEGFVAACLNTITVLWGYLYVTGLV